MKTEYPKWFHQTHEPGYKPIPPQEKVWLYKEISSLSTSEYDHTELTEFPQGANCVTVKIDKDYYNSSITGVQLIFCFKYEVPNPNYEKLYKYYEQRLEEYQARLKEWKQWKKIWDEEQK